MIPRLACYELAARAIQCACERIDRWSDRKRVERLCRYLTRPPIAIERLTGAGARYVDLYPLMHKQAEAKILAGDGLHPSARAHDECAEALYEKLEP